MKLFRQRRSTTAIAALCITGHTLCAGAGYRIVPKKSGATVTVNPNRDLSVTTTSIDQQAIKTIDSVTVASGVSGDTKVQQTLLDAQRVELTVTNATGIVDLSGVVTTSAAPANIEFSKLLEASVVVSEAPNADLDVSPLLRKPLQTQSSKPLTTINSR